MYRLLPMDPTPLDTVTLDHLKLLTPFTRAIEDVPPEEIKDVRIREWEPTTVELVLVYNTPEDAARYMRQIELLQNVYLTP